jgi:hypothetical protein
MAQHPRPAGENGDPFVRHVVADPKNVPDVMLLYGYPGASSEEGHERLYLSPDLSSYVEIPNAAVVHRAESAKEQDPLGGVTLWIKKDAALKYKTAPAAQAAQQALAAYFAGAIQAGMAGMGMAPGAGMAAAGAAAPVLPQTLPPAACPISLVTCVATCHATCAATCLPHATCGATCVATCHATCHFTCAPICTHATPCRPTFNQPDCPYPSEIPAQCTHLPHCPLPQAQVAAAGAQAAMGAGAQIACALGTIHPSVQVACSLATCAPECWVTRYITCNPQCWITRYVTCNIECYVTRNPALCPIATGVACPPPQSIACGGAGPGPIEQAQYCIAGTVRPPQVTLGGCPTVAGCQSLFCPSWNYTCLGCPHTPHCPW